MKRTTSFSILASGTKTIYPVVSITLPKTKDSDGSFTCTGMTYDSSENAIWGGYYGKTIPEDEVQRPALIKLDMEFNILDEIPLKSFVLRNPRMSLQGITYDSVDNSLWFTDSESIYEIDKSGNLLRTLQIDGLQNPNGLVYDYTSDTLWILGYRFYLANIKKDGTIIRKIRCNYFDQDQLMMVGDNIFFTVGADYKGDQNYLGAVDKTTGKVAAIARLAESYAVEGCCVVRNKLYIFNDGFYHDCAIKENLVQVYDWTE